MAGEANQRAPLLDLPHRKHINPYFHILIYLIPIFILIILIYTKTDFRAMFEPRPPLEYKPPIIKKESKPYSGISSYLSFFESTPPPPKEPFETPSERKIRQKEELTRINNEKNELLLSDWKPANNPNATGYVYNAKTYLAYWYTYLLLLYFLYFTHITYIYTHNLHTSLSLPYIYAYIAMHTIPYSSVAYPMTLLKRSLKGSSSSMVL